MAVARELAPLFAKRDAKLLYAFTKRNAIMNCPDVVNLCREIARENKLFGVKEAFGISVSLLYGKFRRFIKKVYYRFVLHVKV